MLFYNAIVKATGAELHTNLFLYFLYFLLWADNLLFDFDIIAFIW